MVNKMEKIKLHTKKSIVWSVLSKPVGMFITLLYTPYLLGYLGNEQYGVWVTILSVINWLNYFDVGIGNGYRNILTEELSQNEYSKAKKTTTTAYIALALIIGTVFFIFSIGYNFIDVNKLFNTRVDISSAFYVSVFFICVNFILALCKTQLYALQKSEVVSFMTVVTNLLNLIGIIILYNTGSKSILYVAVLVGLSTFIVNVFATNKIWGNFAFLIPKKSEFRRNELNSICNIGFKFFGIQIAALVLYTTDNLIITNLFGPEYVTSYATAFSAFGIINSIFSAVLAPLWSRYTLAMVKKDYIWIRTTIIKLDVLMIPVCILLGIGILTFDQISLIWLGKDLNYEYGLIFCMGVYYMIAIFSSIYSTAMNGMGLINIQLKLSVFSAVLNIPLSIFLASYVGLGTTGVILSTIICMLVSGIPIIFYVHSFLNKRI